MKLNQALFSAAMTLTSFSSIGCDKPVAEQVIKGDKGDQGPIGPQGPEGKQGVQGAPGIQGIQGSKGDQGLQGMQGSKGDKGDQGAKGDLGPQGIPGQKGEKGDPGPEGKPGVYDPKCPSFAIKAKINGNINQCLYWIEKKDYEKINGIGAAGITWQQCLKVCAELDMEMINMKSVILACIADPTFYSNNTEKHWVDNETPFAYLDPLNPNGKVVKNICDAANSSDLTGFIPAEYVPGASGGHAFPGWSSNHAYQGGGYGPSGCLCSSKPH